MHPDDELGPPPGLIWDLSVACLASVKATVGIELDFTQDTLPILDHYAKSVLGENVDKVLELVAPMCGAYFGEVVRRHAGGAVRWFTPDADPLAWRLELEPAFCFFNPVGVAVEVIQQDDAPEWWGHLQVLPRDRDRVKAAVELLGEVRPEDYYSFSVRFEVIEQVIQALAAATLDDEVRPVVPAETYEAFALERRRRERELADA